MSDDDLHLSISRNNDSTKERPPTIHASVIKSRDGASWFWHAATSYLPEQNPVKTGFPSRDAAVADVVRFCADILEETSGPMG